MKEYLKQPSNKDYYIADLVFVTGSGQWSIIYNKGKPAYWGDHDNVYDWLLSALEIEQDYDLADGDWCPDGRNPVSLAEAQRNRLERLDRIDQAADMRATAQRLLLEADELERGS